MRVLRLVAMAVTAGAGIASAQLAVSAPTQKLLLLPLSVRAAADSSASIALMDGTRDKLTALAHYKVVVVPKAKLCEALQASGFPCDILMDENQANQLARFLQVNAYDTGWLEHTGSTYIAHVRVHDIGGSGYAAALNVANPAAVALGDSLAGRLNTLVRAGENARDCEDKLSKGNQNGALESARKALGTDPNLAAAHLCIARTYEAMRMPADSLVNAYKRALKGDSLNGTAWYNLAQAYQQKGDTLQEIDAYKHELLGDTRNRDIRLGLAQLLRELKQYGDAAALLADGIKLNPQDGGMHDLRKRICIEGEQWGCVLEELHADFSTDTSKGADTVWVNTCIGAAQKASNTPDQLWCTDVAVKHFAKNANYWNARGQALDGAGKSDSALAAYKQSLALNPANTATSLLVGKFIIDHAVYDTARAGVCQRAKDTVCLKGMQAVFADRVDSALPYLRPALGMADTSAFRLNAIVIMLSGGQKIAQAAAYDRAYPWLDQILTMLAPTGPGDTLGPRQQLRIPTSFWYGLASMQTLGPELIAVQKLKDKSCPQARTVNERLQRTRQALLLGRRVSAPLMDQMLNALPNYERFITQVKAAYKCTGF